MKRMANGVMVKRRIEGSRRRWTGKMMNYLGWDQLNVFSIHRSLELLGETRIEAQDQELWEALSG